MADELLHIRRSYQIEGDKRWVYWSAVLVGDGEERIIASSQPVLKPEAPPASRLKLKENEALPSVWQYEQEMRLVQDGKLLAERLATEGWEALQWNAHGQVIRMRRRSAGDTD